MTILIRCAGSTKRNSAQPDSQLVQMGVGPAHRGLDLVVKLTQGHITIKHQLAPDEWFDILQFDAQCVVFTAICRGPQSLLRCDSML